jgi:hypothetical protein
MSVMAWFRQLRVSGVIGYVNGRCERKKRGEEEIQTLDEVCFGYALYAQGEETE